MARKYLLRVAVPCLAAALTAAGCSNDRGGSGNGAGGAGEGMGPMSPHTDIPDSPGRVPADDTQPGTGGEADRRQAQ